jgi:N-6 DNA Methylase.
LDEHPVSIQVNGQWQTFPNAKAAEEASYEEYKANLRRNAKNFRITDEHLGEGGPKAKFQANVNAIRLLKELEAAGQQASPEQQEVLSRYVGWGGLSDAFDPEKPAWALEYAQLKELLTPEEYAAARGSTLNAHYTSPTVIRAIYETVGRMGFETGNILEPSCGVGNFFGMLPEEMRNSRLYGVELDSISGRIAKQLYPKADITVAGFETTDRRDFYDLAIGNVPFGQYQVRDKAYDKLNFSIHNYFFAKALDQVRPGGVVAFVTSRYTMDAKDSTVRRYLAQRAELLGVIRLPNDAFKKNAGAEVVSDIIFLQKRDRPLDIVPEWTQTGQTEDGFAICVAGVHTQKICTKQRRFLSACTCTDLQDNVLFIVRILGRRRIFNSCSSSSMRFFASDNSSFAISRISSSFSSSNIARLSSTSCFACLYCL